MAEQEVRRRGSRGSGLAPRFSESSLSGDAVVQMRSTTTKPLGERVANCSIKGIEPVREENVKLRVGPMDGVPLATRVRWRRSEGFLRKDGWDAGFCGCDHSLRVKWVGCGHDQVVEVLLGQHFRVRSVEIRVELFGHTRSHCASEFRHGDQVRIGMIIDGSGVFFAKQACPDDADSQEVILRNADFCPNGGVFFFGWVKIGFPYAENTTKAQE